MKKRGVVIAVVIVCFLVLWFSDVLPKQVVKLVSSSYMSVQEDGDNYKLKMVEYSPAHDCYFAYFYDVKNPDGNTRNIGVYYRWLPFDVYFDSKFPG